MKKCTTCVTTFNSADWQCPSCKKVPELHDGYPVFSPKFSKSSGGFKEEYFIQLARLEAGNFWFCCRNRLISWAIKRYFSRASSFLEIGCGTGFVLSLVEDLFPNSSLYGSDLHVEGLKLAKQRLQKTVLFQMDACEVPFVDEFAVIGAFDLLEHIQDDNLALAQICQALHKGGGVILTVPQHNFLWSRFDEAACHQRRYSKKELKAKVELAGFKVVKAISFVSLLFPLVLISRLRLQKIPPKNYNVMQTLKFSPLTSAVLTKILGFERLLIRLGTVFPFGSSLLLIARKL